MSLHHELDRLSDFRVERQLADPDEAICREAKLQEASQALFGERVPETWLTHVMIAAAPASGSSDLNNSREETGLTVDASGFQERQVMHIPRFSAQWKALLTEEYCYDNETIIKHSRLTTPELRLALLKGLEVHTLNENNIALVNHLLPLAIFPVVLVGVIISPTVGVAMACILGGLSILGRLFAPARALTAKSNTYALEFLKDAASPATLSCKLLRKAQQFPELAHTLQRWEAEGGLSRADIRELRWRYRELKYRAKLARKRATLQALVEGKQGTIAPDGSFTENGCLPSDAWTLTDKEPIELGRTSAQS